MKVIAQYTYTNMHAGPKAKIDVERILKKHYNADIKPFKCKTDADSALQKLIYRGRKMLYMFKNRFSRSDILVIQAPFSKKTAVPFPAKHRIALIHDIDGLRQSNEQMAKSELAILDSCDVIISHNSKMTDYLIKGGISKKIVDLELFDYICIDSAPIREDSFETPVIAYAGNLQKSDFVKELDIDKINFEFNLYGPGASEDINPKMHYKGAFSPDYLPDKLEGNLGLVWDGSPSESDADTGFKNYTKYNNPHKLSCYIAAGLPVIVWSKSAAAEFVKKYNIGYTVSNLYEINSIDFSDYITKKQNVYTLSEKVRNGGFTKAAIDKAIALIKQEEK